MTRILTVTIGIPAHNEASNISILLEQLQRQKQIGLKIEQIIIASDGSSDNTVSVVAKKKDPRIRVIDGEKSLGKAMRLNQIISQTNSDILVLLDADIAIMDKLFIKKLINPIVKLSMGLVSTRVEPIEEQGLLPRVLAASMFWKQALFERINHGLNIYTCHGRARALSRKFYQSLKFKYNASEDAYSYLVAKNKGFGYDYVANTQVFFKLPHVFTDHFKQSNRFFSTRKGLVSQFGFSQVKAEYTIPKKVLIQATLFSLYKKPLLGLYFVVFFTSKVLTTIFPDTRDNWQMATSTKKLPRRQYV